MNASEPPHFRVRRPGLVRGRGGDPSALEISSPSLYEILTLLSPSKWRGNVTKILMAEGAGRGRAPARGARREAKGETPSGGAVTTKP